MGLLKRTLDKVAELDTEHKLVFIHCIIHQHALCKSVLKLNNVVVVVTKTINFYQGTSIEAQAVCCTFRRSG